MFVNSARAGGTGERPTAYSPGRWLITPRRDRSLQPRNLAPTPPRDSRSGAAPGTPGQGADRLAAHGDEGAARPRLLSGAASCPHAPLAGEAGQVTAPVRPTPPAASPHPVLSRHHRGPIGTSPESRGVPPRPTCAKAAPDARATAASALRHSGRAGGGPAPALRRLPAAAGSAGSPGAGRLAASDRLHCDAAPSAGQSRRRGANR